MNGFCESITPSAIFIARQNTAQNGFVSIVFLMQEITMHEITMQGSQFDLINSYNLKDYMLNARINSCLPETTPS